MGTGMPRALAWKVQNLKSKPTSNAFWQVEKVERPCCWFVQQQQQRRKSSLVFPSLSSAVGFYFTLRLKEVETHLRLRFPSTSLQSFPLHRFHESRRLDEHKTPTRPRRDGSAAGVNSVPLLESATPRGGAHPSALEEPFGGCRPCPGGWWAGPPPDDGS